MQYESSGQFPSELNTSSQTIGLDTSSNGKYIASKSSLNQVESELEVKGTLPIAIPNRRERWDVNELLSLGDGITGTIRSPALSFEPNDQWAVEFRKGIALANLEGRIYEGGAGGGGNGIYSAAIFPNIVKYYTSDYDPVVAELCRENVLNIKGIPTYKFHPLLGQSDLLEAFRRDIGEKAPLDVVLGCLPQVRKLEGTEHQVDHHAHYYGGPVLKGFESLDHYGLTLNARCLLEARQHLTLEEGRVILNLAGRVPTDIIEGMFTAMGFGKIKYLNTAVIHQHEQTNLGYFIEQESTHGVKFNFYKTPECNEKITAKEAQRLIDSGQSAYHELFVIEGTYLGSN